MASSVDPRLEARCPPFVATTSRMRCRISAASWGSWARLSRLRSPGLLIVSSNVDIDYILSFRAITYIYCVRVPSHIPRDNVCRNSSQTLGAMLKRRQSANAFLHQLHSVLAGHLY